MIFFRYRKYLEKQVEELKAEKKELQARNDLLIQALVPSIRRNEEQKKQITAGDVIASKREHKLNTETKGKASCSCGWNAYSDDEGKLQEEIASHFRKNVGTVKGSRRTWPQTRDLLEQEGGKEA